MTATAGYLLDPRNWGRFQTRISRLAFSGTQAARIVQVADFQRFLAQLGTPADARDANAAGAGDSAGQRVLEAPGQSAARRVRLFPSACAR